MFSLEFHSWFFFAFSKISDLGDKIFDLVNALRMASGLKELYIDGLIVRLFVFVGY